MPRRPRDEGPGALHHVFNRGAKKSLIFVDDDDCERYLELLGKTVDEFAWRCLAYSLMRNHMHLVLETPEPNLGRGMEVFHGQYAREFNERYRGSGHVFQGRYGSQRVYTDSYLLWVVQYVDRNPVKAGFVDVSEDWKWGSSATVASGDAPTWLDNARWRELVDGAYGPAPGTGASG